MTHPEKKTSAEILSRATAARLSDEALMEAMRAREPLAWAEWDARFRPVLEQYAKRVGIPRWDAAVHVTEVLEIEGMRFAFRERTLPDRFASYLCVAVRNRFLSARRASVLRHQKYEKASAGNPEGAVRSVASAYAIHASAGPGAPNEISEPRRAIARFVRWLEQNLDEEEQLMLGWLAEQVPRRVVASWLNISYEAAKKRCSRLAARTRTLAARYVLEAPAEDRVAVQALFERIHAGATPRKSAL